jgi:hypothetical protein
MQAVLGWVDLQGAVLVRLKRVELGVVSEVLVSAARSEL